METRQQKMQVKKMDRQMTLLKHHIIRILMLVLYLLGFTPMIAAQTDHLQPYAKKIAKAIAERANITKNKTVRLDYFTFEQTEMAAVFSRELYLALSKELPKAGMLIRENTNDLIQQKNWVGQDDYVVCGTYQAQKEGVVVQAYLYDLNQKQPIRYVKEAIPTDTLTKYKIVWKPTKLEEAKRTRNLIVEDEETPPPATPSSDPLPVPEPKPSQGDFALALMTSKGVGHQVFTEGEQMSIAVKATRACFLRLVYHTADGQKVLLLENVPMKVSDAGNYITVPQVFECAAPFGVETLQLFACTTIFPPLKTHAQDGFVFIDEDIASVNTKTRGFKPITGDKQEKKEALLKSEVSLQVTTLPK